MAEQAMQLCYTTAFVDVTNAPAAELAAKLARLAPGSSSMSPLRRPAPAQSIPRSGSRISIIRAAASPRATTSSRARTPIMARPISALRLACAMATARKFSICPGSRASSLGALSLSAAGWHDGRQFTDLLVEEFKAKIAEVGAENIAAFIAEPTQASGGCHTAAGLFHAHVGSGQGARHSVHRR